MIRLIFVSTMRNSKKLIPINNTRLKIGTTFKKKAERKKKKKDDRTTYIYI